MMFPRGLSGGAHHATEHITELKGFIVRTPLGHKSSLDVFLKEMLKLREKFGACFRNHRVGVSGLFSARRQIS